MDKAVESYKGIAAFQPVINGVGGNLAGVQSSRLSTYLHRHGPLGQLPPEEGERVCISPWSLYVGKSTRNLISNQSFQQFNADLNFLLILDIHSTTARVLLAFVAPGHMLFAIAITFLKHGEAHTSLTPFFMTGYLIAAVLQVN